MTLFGGFAPNNVCPTDHSTVLNAIMRKLQNDLADVFSNEAVLYISDQEVSVEMTDNISCTVSPREGQFPSDTIDGAGQYAVFENANIDVTVRSRIQTDQTERSTEAYLDSERGLLPLKKRVLKSLAGQQLYANPTFGTQDDYDISQGALLTAVMAPVRASHQSGQLQDEFSEFTLTFACQFGWDLS